MNDIKETTQLAERYAQELVAFFGINSNVRGEETEDGIELDITNTLSAPRLIGHHGETLRAMEYLVNQMAKHHDAEAPRIFLDVAGYRQARRAALEEQARQVARRVVERRMEEELRPMNSAERRIVHMILREDTSVVTESRGEGRQRRIVVKPAE